jgi:hypothetical protein
MSNVLDELDDDALSDGGEDELTPEQQGMLGNDLCGTSMLTPIVDQMNDGLERVRAIIGPQEDSGLEDSMIKDALWNEYFNVDHAVQWLLGVSGFILIYYFELMCAQ